MCVPLSLTNNTKYNRTKSAALYFWSRCLISSFSLHWTATTDSRSQSNMSITSSTNTCFSPPAVTSRDAITGNCWHPTTIPHTGALGTGHMQLASLGDQRCEEDCLSFILGNQIRDLILTLRLAEIGQWYTQFQWGWCCSYLHQLSRGQGQVSSVPEARGIKGKLQQLLQDYPSKAGRGGQAKGFQQGQLCSKHSWKPAHPQDSRCCRSKGSPDP